VLLQVGSNAGDRGFVRSWKPEVFPPERHYGYARGDRDRDGVPNRYDRDRDGDGVPNKYDSAPDNPNRR